jgi:hypothetical protein
MSEVRKHLPVKPSIPLKKYMVWSKYRGYKDHGNIALMQFMQEMIPEFVFHPYHERWLHAAYEFAGILVGIKRQISDEIYSLIIAPCVKT